MLEDFRVYISVPHYGLQGDSITLPDPISVRIRNCMATDDLAGRRWIGMAELKTKVENIKELLVDRLELSTRPETSRTGMFSLRFFSISIMFYLPNPVDLWTYFENTFSSLSGIFQNSRYFYDYALQSFQTSYDDNIRHLEIRLLSDRTWFDDEGCEYGSEKGIELLTKAFEEFRRTHPDFSFYIIYSLLRFQDADSVRKELEKVLDLIPKFPLLRGFDLVGEEEKGFSLYDYKEPLLWFMEEQQIR